MTYQHNEPLKLAPVRLERALAIILAISTLTFMWLAWRNAQPMDCDQVTYKGGAQICEKYIGTKTFRNWIEGTTEVSAAVDLNTAVAEEKSPILTPTYDSYPPIHLGYDTLVDGEQYDIQPAAGYRLLFPDMIESNYNGLLQ